MRPGPINRLPRRWPGSIHHRGASRAFARCLHWLRVWVAMPTAPHSPDPGAPSRYRPRPAPAWSGESRHRGQGAQARLKALGPGRRWGGWFRSAGGLVLRSKCPARRSRLLRAGQEGIPEHRSAPPAPGLRPQAPFPLA